MNRKVKVIFDTNVWISYLIGKRLTSLTNFISNEQIEIIITEQLLLEIEIVTQRPKLKKYFPKDKVETLFSLLEIIASKVEITPKYFVNRDPKDNFLLDLIHFSRADFLVTGDKDLLGLNPFLTAQIITPRDFEELINKKV